MSVDLGQTTQGPTSRSSSRRAIGFALAAVVCVLAVAVVILQSRSRQYAPILDEAVANVEEPNGVRVHAPAPLSLRPYEGLGTWLDAFDYSPAYEVSMASRAELDAMAAAGVKTIFVQSGRLDDRSPDLLEDRWVLADLLLHAHQRDIAVVAWFLPKWTDEAADLDHLVAASEFDVLGHRFDGVAVDIEWNQAGLEHAERSRRLVTLSQRLDELTGDTPIGAIVMPPVLLEVINDQFWPEFPWTELADHYDVWLPMSYWSFRSNESGYGGGYLYNFESTQRLRENLGDPNAVVHGIGGIGATAGERDFSTGEPIAAIDDLALFAQSLADSESVGGSIYDWMTLDAQSRTALAELFASGAASDLPAASG